MPAMQITSDIVHTLEHLARRARIARTQPGSSGKRDASEMPISFYCAPVPVAADTRGGLVWYASRLTRM